MSILSGKSGHDIFVYGSLQDPEVVYVLLNRVPDHIPAVLSGFHRFRIKNRIYPTILPDGTGEVSGKVLKGIKDDELKVLDEFEDVEYDRKAVQVVLTTLENPRSIACRSADLRAIASATSGEVTKLWCSDPVIVVEDSASWKIHPIPAFRDSLFQAPSVWQWIVPSGIAGEGKDEAKDSSEKLQVETYVWRNKDDPDLYGEWDLEEWKRHDSEDFITATKKFVEERKLPKAKTRIDTFKTFFNQDTEDVKPRDS